MARTANRLYTYADLRAAVNNGQLAQRYAFPENDDRCVNKANTASRVYVYPDNMPNDRMPTWDDLTAIPPVTIGWSCEEDPNPYVDCNIRVYLKGELVAQSFFTETGTISGFSGGRPGDEVTFQLFSVAAYPWPEGGVGHLELWANGAKIHADSSSAWVADVVILSHTFTIAAGVNYLCKGYTVAPDIYNCGTGFHDLTYMENDIWEMISDVGTNSGNIIVDWYAYGYYYLDVIYEGNIIYSLDLNGETSGSISFNWTYNTSTQIKFRYTSYYV